MTAQEAPDEPVEVLSPADSASSAFSLPNGRQIGYAQYGAATGPAIILLHGAPGSRIDAQRWTSLATQLGCRLVSLDRPGIGLSGALTTRSLGGYPSDVLALADHLSLESFRLLGVSGGGPYALACATALPPHRLLATGIVAGMGPPDAGRLGLSWMWYVMWKIGPWAPWLVRWFARYQFGDGSEETIVKMLQADKARMKEGSEESKLLDEIWDAVVLGHREVVRQGVDGYVQDLLVLSQPWDFNLDDAHGRVRLWYGECDTMATPDMGRWVRNRLENADLTVYENCTHSTLMTRHDREIFQELLMEG